MHAYVDMVAMKARPPECIWFDALGVATSNEYENKPTHPKATPKGLSPLEACTLIGEPYLPVLMLQYKGSMQDH